MTWILENLGTIFVCAILIVIVVVILKVMIRDKKNGKHSCGGNCGHCPMGGFCSRH